MISPVLDAAARAGRCMPGNKDSLMADAGGDDTPVIDRILYRTPLYSTLQQKGAVFGQIGGWERAFWFDLDGSDDPQQLSFRS